MQTLSVKALAAAFGIHWGICLLVLGWGSMFGWGEEFVEVIASFYVGFDSSFLGGIIGAIWAFIGGAIGGAIVASVYNMFAKRV